MTDSYNDHNSGSSISDSLINAAGLPSKKLSLSFLAALMSERAKRNQNGKKPKSDDALLLLMLTSPPSLATITLVETPTPTSRNAPENTWGPQLITSLTAALSGMVAAKDRNYYDAELDLAAA